MNYRRELIWRKSSRSSSGACVELAEDGDKVHMRNSNDPSGATLTFDRDVLRDFIEQVKSTGQIAE